MSISRRTPHWSGCCLVCPGRPRCRHAGTLYLHTGRPPCRYSVPAHVQGCASSTLFASCPPRRRRYLLYGKLVFAAADTLAAPQLPFLVATARRYHDRSFLGLRRSTNPTLFSCWKLLDSVGSTLKRERSRERGGH
jgi:hypothetical protein